MGIAIGNVVMSEPILEIVQATPDCILRGVKVEAFLVNGDQRFPLGMVRVIAFSASGKDRPSMTVQTSVGNFEFRGSVNIVMPNRAEGQ